MSLSQRERRNPPPRQKSCAACIKAKRRCDAALPACLRCAQRGIPCVMPARQRGNRSVAGTTAVIPVSAAPPTPPAMYDLGDFMGIALPPTQTGCSGDWDALLSSLEPMLSTTCFDLETSPTFKDFLPGPMEATVYPEQLGIVHQQSTMSAPTSKRFERPPYMVYKKLSYALDEIKKAPSMMVLETQTPWCHPKLYESGMPRSMQDAHASCALYMAKNRANGPVILRSIESRVSDLVNSPYETTPLEILARTQSLVLYYIICVFDGDISARASAERTQSALEDAVMSLILQLDLDTPLPSIRAATEAVDAQTQLPLSAIGPASSFWQDWIFKESARRTLLFTFFFLQAYRVLSGQRTEPCDGRLNRHHSFTLSASMWEADGPLAFAKAWSEKNHLVVADMNFNEVYEEARADDVDAFGKMMLTTLMGIDEAEGWFAAKGGSLRPVS